MLKLAPTHQHITDLAESLVDRLKGQSLPADFEIGDGHYNLLIAHIRHEFTNYEELLWKLPGCPMECTAIEDGDECIYQIMAHDTLKWAAKALAEELYSTWHEAHK